MKNLNKFSHECHKCNNRVSLELCGESTTFTCQKCGSYYRRDSQVQDETTFSFHPSPEDASDQHAKLGEVLDKIERVFGVPICPEKCPYMSVWEFNQTDKKAPHVCHRYDVTLNHGTKHPRIVRAPNCDYKD